MKGVAAAAGWTYEGSHCQELRLYVIAILGVSIFPLQMAMNAKIWNWKKCSFEFLQIATMNVVCGAIWRVSTFITHSKLPICQNAPYWSVCSNQRWNALKSAGNPSTMLGTELQMKHWWKIIKRNAEIKFVFLFDIKLKINLKIFHSGRCSFLSWRNCTLYVNTNGNFTLPHVGTQWRKCTLSIHQKYRNLKKKNILEKKGLSLFRSHHRSNEVWKTVE